MVKTLLLACTLGSLVSVAACSTDNSSQLADLSTQYGATTMEIMAHDQISVVLHVAGDACPTLADNVHATFNGQEMNVDRGGRAIDSSGCYPISFWFENDPTVALANYERSAMSSSGTGGSDMIIADDASTWHVSPTKLFSNAIVNDVANSRLVWPDVDNISTARIEPYTENLKIDGSNIYYPVGTDVSYADALAHPTPTVCDGPGSCLVNLERANQFNGGTPQ
jgi:hypothetical protein